MYLLLKMGFNHVKRDDKLFFYERRDIVLPLSEKDTSAQEGRTTPMQPTLMRHRPIPTLLHGRGAVGGQRRKRWVETTVWKRPALDHTTWWIEGRLDP